MIEAYFDGCCEPVNPGGTAAFGAVIFKDQQRVWECSRLFTESNDTSNNVAEYCGFLAIVEELLRRGWQEQPILVRGDSKLVIKQIFGTWRIRQGAYVPYAQKAKRLLRKFPYLTGEWIPREQNGMADQLSKAELVKAGVKFRIQPIEQETTWPRGSVPDAQQLHKLQAASSILAPATSSGDGPTA